MPQVTDQATVEPLPAGVTRIALPVPGFGSGVNVHLLRGRGPTTLVDTGVRLPGAMDWIADALASIGTAVEEIDQVLITHHHVDHIGLTGEIVAASGAAVRAVPVVAEVLADPAAHFDFEFAWAEQHARRHGAPEDLLEGSRNALPFMRKVRAATVERPLALGETVAAGDLQLTVASRPGHSATDTIFQDDEHRVTVVGDHLWTGSPVTPVLGSMLTLDDRPAAGYLAGLEQTRTLDGYRLLTGHGGAIEEVGTLLDERLEGLERRIGRVQAVLPTTSLTTWEVGLLVWRPGNPGLRGLARLSALLAALELLEDRGAVRRVGTDDAVRWIRQ